MHRRLDILNILAAAAALAIAVPASAQEWKNETDGSAPEPRPAGDSLDSGEDDGGAVDLGAHPEAAGLDDENDTGGDDGSGARDPSLPQMITETAPTATAESSSDDDGGDAESKNAALSQQLGARLGFELGGRTSPGGMHLAGNYLYRVSDQDWFETGAGFTFGGGSPACFRDRMDELVCDHGIAKGFAAELMAGARRVFPAQKSLAPFVGIGLGVRVVSFPDDDVLGAAFPLIVSGGIRAPVTGKIAIVGGGVLRAGIGAFGDELGAEPHLTMAIHGGVEFGLD